MGDLERAFLDFRHTGSPRAMARVFDHAAPELLLVAGHLASDAAEAEDLVQSTLLAAIERRERFDPARRVMPWLLGILVNLHRGNCKRRTALPIPEGWPADGRDPADSAADAELAERLDQALASLPASCREPLRLRLVHGLEPVQIAHALGRPLETVRTQLRRGRERLRDALPSSLAGAFVGDLGLGSENLAAMREVVLARALATPAASVALTAGPGGVALLSGAIVMKKMLVVVLVLLVIGAGYLLTRDADLPAPSLALEAGAPAGSSVERARAPVAERAEAPDPARVVVAREEAARATALSCQVLWDEDGAPAAGVAVRLACEASGEFEADRVAETDDRGLARFLDVPAGHAWLDGDRGGSIELDVAEGADDEVELRIPRGVLVRGTVVDARDRPVAGAELWVSGRTSTTYYGTYSGASGPDGRFELRAVQPRRIVGARLEGFAPAVPVMVPGEPGDELEITLCIGSECARVRGIVRGPDGQPRADGVVFVGDAAHAPRTTTGGRLLGGAPPVWAYTEDDGTFTAEVPPGTTPIWARARGTAAWHETLEVAGPETWIEIDLAPAASVAGRVLDLDGEPMQRVLVRALQDGIEAEPGMAFTGPWWALPIAHTDADGAFRLTNVLPGHATIVAEDDQEEVAVALDLVAGEETSCELVFGTAPRITGVVVDENGEPVVDIQVGGSAEVGGNHHLRDVRTGTDGRFELVDCTRERYTLSASDVRADVNPYVRVYGVVPGGEPVRIVFASDDLASSRITGSLVHPDGSWVTSGRMSLARLGPDGTTQWAGFHTMFENGLFRTGLLPPGTYLLTVRGEETGSWTREVELGPDEELDLGEIEVADPGRIELVLEGVFEAETRAFIHVEGVPWAMSFQLHEGRGTSGPLQPGSYRVGFGGYHVPLHSEEVEVRPGETTPVVMSLGNAVRRRVRTPRVPVDDFVLTQTWMDGAGTVIAKLCWGVQRREADSAHERLLVPGSYRVVVEALDGRRAETSFVVSDDPESDQVIELPSPAQGRLRPRESGLRD